MSSNSYHSLFEDALRKSIALSPTLVMTSRPSGPPKPHSNNCARFLIVLEGSKHLKLIDTSGREKNVTLNRGEAIFGAPGNCFWDIWDTAMTAFSIVFTPNFMRFVLIEHDGVHPHQQAPVIGKDTQTVGPGWKGTYLHLEWRGSSVVSSIVAVLNALAENASNKIPGGDELLLALLKNVLWQMEMPKDETLYSRAERLWHDINDYIEMHFTEPFLREKTAKAFLIHPDHLTRLFKMHGLSFTMAITRRRLELASSLLRNSKLSIGEIAAQCGFSSPSYFNRCFLRQYNLAPGKFRM